MTPSSRTLRLLLFKMTVTGDSPVVKRKKFLKMKSLSEEERHLHWRKIPHASLMTLAMTPWRNLLALEVDQALITMTGFDGVSLCLFCRSSLHCSMTIPPSTQADGIVPASIFSLLRSRGADPKTSFSAYYESHSKRSDITNEDISRALKVAVTFLE